MLVISSQQGLKYIKNQHIFSSFTNYSSLIDFSVRLQFFESMDPGFATSGGSI